MTDSISVGSAADGLLLALTACVPAQQPKPPPPPAAAGNGTANGTANATGGGGAGKGASKKGKAGGDAKGGDQKAEDQKSWDVSHGAMPMMPSHHDVPVDWSGSLLAGAWPARCGAGAQA